MLHVTVEDYRDLTAFIYKKSGIKFEDKKRYFINKRLEKRIDALELQSTREYLRYLKFRDPDGDEFQELMNLLTVNETYFFREFPTLEAFAEFCLFETAERKKEKGDKTIRIWSAGCSTGEEPYTLAIILKEILEDSDGWKLEIIASDIDLEVLEKARNGVYDDRSVKDVPEEYYQKYFEYKNGMHCVRPVLKNIVKFEHINLMDRLEMRKKRDIDFVFCRNVLIYFDEISRKQVVDHFYISLNQGGYIYLGHSESVGRITTAFKLKRYGKNVVYYKG